LTIFLDEFRRYENYVKKEVTFVNYVRDPKQAQVYVLFLSRETGSGGRENTLYFAGQKEFAGINDTLSFITKPLGTEDIRRRELVKVLKIGLMKYIARTPQRNNIIINYKPSIGEELPEEVKDKWNYWVFNISPDFNYRAEESYKNLEFNCRLSSNRITENWKIELFYENEYQESENVTPEKTYRTIRRTNTFQGLIVKSINNNWSAGVDTRANSSTRFNTRLSLSVAPAIEYNIFPYSQSTRRQLRFLLSLWAKNVQYNEETIFYKKSENLFGTSLRISESIYEKWGNIWSSLEGILFFHDTGVNRLEFDGGINYRIFEGLSLRIRGEISLIHDQLFLPIKESTPEEILLRVRQLKTNWEYRISFGFNYRFGSKYSNIVNPRFDRGRRGYRFR
ncbi:hypothetical protein DRQ09_04285, partial [candidate division KSB1 bacterium]